MPSDEQFRALLSEMRLLREQISAMSSGRIVWNPDDHCRTERIYDDGDCFCERIWHPKNFPPAKGEPPYYDRWRKYPHAMNEEERKRAGYRPRQSIF
jgi:hypothetical protein